MNKQLVITILSLFSIHSFACTTIVVGKKASATGEIMFGRNLDTTPAARAKHFKIYAHSGQNARFVALPYYNSESADGMLQIATNEYGVAISATETIISNNTALKYDPYVKNGVKEFNVTKPVMEQAKNAQQAVELIGNKITTVGAAEGFGIVVADKNEAWYLETASGTHWVAARIPDDTYFVSVNQGRIQQVKFKQNGEYADGYMGSADLIQFAKHNGFYQQYKGKFDFRKTYQRLINVQTGDMANDINYNYLRIATLQNMFSGRPIDNFQNGEFPTFLKPKHKLTEHDIEAGLSNYYKGSVNDPYTKVDAKATYRPISVFRASSSHVTVMRNIPDINIANVEYIAMGMSSLSIYIPFYYGITEVPVTYTIGNGNADNDSAFWKFRKLQALTFTDFAHNEPIVRKKLDSVNLEIRERQKIMEAAYLKFHDPKLIQQFIDNSVKLALATADNLTIQLENYYNMTHTNNVDFTNEYYDQLTNEVYQKYRFPGF